MVLSTACLSRWHVARVFGESAVEIFKSYKDDDVLTMSLSAIVLYICLHLPLRFMLTVPICTLAPTIYVVLAIMLGTPCEHDGRLTHWQAATLESENTMWIIFLVVMSLFGVHFIERQDREVFLTLVRSFEMVQELEEKETDVDDGSTAMGKARQSLKVAAAAITQLSGEPDLPQGLAARMVGIK